MIRTVDLPYPATALCPQCGQDDGVLQPPVGGMERLACDCCGHAGPLAPESVTLRSGEWGVLAAMSWNAEIAKAKRPAECAA